MGAPEAFDMGLALLVVAVAGWTVAARSSFAAVTGFVVYGLLLALAWVRLSAVDIALTEAAIGSGMTGVLLLRAAFRIRTPDPVSGRPGRALRSGAALLCAAVTAGLAAIVLLPADPAPTLAPQVATNLHALDLGNPVPACSSASAPSIRSSRRSSCCWRSSACGRLRPTGTGAARRRFGARPTIPIRS